MINTIAHICLDVCMTSIAIDVLVWFHGEWIKIMGELRNRES